MSKKKLIVYIEDAFSNCLEEVKIILTARGFEVVVGALEEALGNLRNLSLTDLFLIEPFGIFDIENLLNFIRQVNSAASIAFFTAQNPKDVSFFVGPKIFKPLSAGKLVGEINKLI